MAKTIPVDERRATAFHEAGHAVFAFHCNQGLGEIGEHTSDYGTGLKYVGWHTDEYPMYYYKCVGLLAGYASEQLANCTGEQGNIPGAATDLVHATLCLEAICQSRSIASQGKGKSLQCEIIAYLLKISDVVGDHLSKAPVKHAIEAVALRVIAGPLPVPGSEIEDIVTKYLHRHDQPSISIPDWFWEACESVGKPVLSQEEFEEIAEGYEKRPSLPPPANSS